MTQPSLPAIVLLDAALVTVGRKLTLAFSHVDSLRHNSLQKAIAFALRTVDNTEVILEVPQPLRRVPGSSARPPRTDIKVTGRASMAAAKMELDGSVHSIYSQEAKRIRLKAQRDESKRIAHKCRKWRSGSLEP